MGVFEKGNGGREDVDVPLPCMPFTHNRALALAIKRNKMGWNK
jgi:hypothetical protein